MKEATPPRAVEYYPKTHSKTSVLKNPFFVAPKSEKTARKWSTYPISKWINYVVFFVCFLICCYQVGVFCQIYLSFPTTVYIRLEQTARNPIPAIAICNRNLFKRSALCRISEKYCDKKTLFNEEKDLTAEIEEAIWKNYSYFTHSENIFSSCFVRTETNQNINITNYCLTNARWIHNGAHACWTLNSRWDETILSHVNDTRLIGVNLVFNFEPEEYTFAEDPVFYRGYLYFISPDDVPSNAVHSFTVYAKRGYYIKFSKSTIKRLTPPYETMCRNYSDEFLKRGKTGSYSQQTCYYHCMWKRLQDKCGCIPREIPFSNEYIPCTKLQEPNCSEVFNDSKNVCAESCPIGCTTILFEAVTYGMNDISGNQTRVWLDIRGTVQFTYEHRERFTLVELFGYVGGFSGIWLGLSVPTVYDLFQEFFLHMYNKRKLDKKNAKMRVSLQ